MIYFYGEKFYIEYIIIAKNLPVSKKIRIFANRLGNWYIYINAGVAQLVERRTCNAKVVGSYPSTGSKVL